MPTLESRLTEMERRLKPASAPGLVLLLTSEPTQEQLQAIAQAEAEGRPVLLVRVVKASQTRPERTGTEQ